MVAEIIILAQGTQKRLGMQHGYKQLLPLPHCGGAPILYRTLRQWRHLSPDDAIVIVGWLPLCDQLASHAVRDGMGHVFCDSSVALADPGNSALKGVSRYLENRGVHHGFAHTVVLLGDVVYSWAALRAIQRASQSWGFVGTPVLSANRGELWGVGWSRGHEPMMMDDLRDAVLRSSPFEEDYQHAQVRRWISGWRRGDLVDHVSKLRDRRAYTDITDYTMDVDTADDILRLTPVSVDAAQDDAREGISWRA